MSHAAPRGADRRARGPEHDFASDAPAPAARPIREAGEPATDLRLALPAAVAWLAATAATRLSLAAMAVAGAAAISVGAAAVVAADRVGARRLTGALRPHGLSRLAATAALCLAVAAAVLASGAAQRSAPSHGLLPEAASSGASVRLVATVTGDPRVLTPFWPGAPARVTVIVSAVRVTSDGRAGAAAGQVLVVGPAAWAGAPYRARVEVVGRLTADASHGRAVAVLTTAGAPNVVGAPPEWARATSAVRSRVLTLAEREPGDAGALLAAIVVGDTSRMPTDLTAALRTAGLTHVTAVSGAHFSLVVALMLAVTTVAGAPRWARAAAALLATAATVALVHPDPSVQRAAAMGLVAVGGLVVGRRGQAPAALAAGVIALLAVDPWLASELGFVLSVVATGGLVVLGQPLTERWAPRLGRPLAEALALPVAAQLCCAPVLLLVAPTVATYAVPANVLAAPAVGPATVLGLLSGVVDPACPGLAHVLASCAGAACWWVGAVARLASAAPGARVAWLPGAVGLASLALAVGATSTLLLRRRTP